MISRHERGAVIAAIYRRPKALLDEAIDACGGLQRWNEISWFRAHLSIRGELLARTGYPGALDDLRVEGTTRVQHARVTNVGVPGRTAIVRPDRVRLEDADGTVVTEREKPRAAFDGHVETTRWDWIHLAYFSGCVSWESLMTPFVLADGGVQTEELEPWDEDGERWRRLFVWLPETIAAHTRQQTFYFAPDGRQRRIDYRLELAGGIDVALYCTDHETFAGMTLPTRRRMLRRDRHDNAVPASILVDIAIIDAGFA